MSKPTAAEIQAAREALLSVQCNEVPGLEHWNEPIKYWTENTYQSIDGHWCVHYRSWRHGRDFCGQGETLDEATAEAIRMAHAAMRRPSPFENGGANAAT